LEHGMRGNDRQSKPGNFLDFRCGSEPVLAIVFPLTGRRLVAKARAGRRRWR
jgi:hypothetical protein